MGILTVILSAISALIGPVKDVLTAIYSAWEAFHENGDATPEELIADAQAIFVKVAPLISDVQTQIALIAQALQEKNATLPATVATTVAAAVVHAGVPKTS